MQQEIYDLISHRKRTARELADRLWCLYPECDRPQLKCIASHIYQANRKLCYRGERIYSVRRGIGRGSVEGFYIILKVRPHAYSERKSAGNTHAAIMARIESASAARGDL